MTRLTTLLSFYMPLALVLSFIVSNISIVQGKVVTPVLFIFGDSFTDVGNSNYLPTSVKKANIPPYGDTFFNEPTGRFSDGRLITDFIAQYAEIPFAPPFLLPELSSYKDGVNFACGGSGALNETFESRGIPLKTQVEYYKKVAANLTRQFGHGTSKTIISKSVYIVNVGTNDYLHPLSTNPGAITPQYVSLVIGNITLAIKELYRLGGRKFVINNLGPLGCLPLVKAALNSSTCFQPASQIAALHNQQLSEALLTLSRQHTGFKYGLFDVYTNLEKMINNPADYGLKNSTTACCGSGPFRGIFSCGGQENFTSYELCSNPNEFVFWDSAHPGDMTYNQLARLMWAGSSPDIEPYNVKTLFEMGNGMLIKEKTENVLSRKRATV